jgi:hypothetical protein
MYHSFALVKMGQAGDPLGTLHLDSRFFVVVGKQAGAQAVAVCIAVAGLLGATIRRDYAIGA